MVLSDTHLGTFGCHAKELLQYLKSIKPKKVVLNGDIIDIWQFSKRSWNFYHMMILKEIVKWITNGVHVYYLPGNHDEKIRQFEGLTLRNFYIKNKLRLSLGEDEVWMFHGDVFDVVMKYSKWLAKLGATGYDILIIINRLVNYVMKKLNRPKVSLSQRVKNGVKSAVKFINDFENTVCEIAAENGFKFVVCGHIHYPIIKKIQTPHGEVTYLNSGDWIENLTALEYHQGEWKIYRYQEDEVAKSIAIKNETHDAENLELILNHMLHAKAN